MIYLKKSLMNIRLPPQLHQTLSHAQSLRYLVSLPQSLLKGRKKLFSLAISLPLLQRIHLHQNPRQAILLELEY